MIYLLKDDVVYALGKAFMLLTQKLLEILEAIDCAVEINFVDEIVCYFEFMELLLYLGFDLFLLLGFLVNKNHFYIRHRYI